MHAHGYGKQGPSVGWAKDGDRAAYEMPDRAGKKR